MVYKDKQKEYADKYRLSGKKSEANKKYYLKNKDKIKERMRTYTKTIKEKGIVRKRDRGNYHVEYVRQRRIVNREYIDSLKQERGGCILCGEDDPITLDFHHRDPANKEFSISIGKVKGFSLFRIIKEIEKCDLVCANCHRKIEYKKRKGG